MKPEKKLITYAKEYFKQPDIDSKSRKGELVQKREYVYYYGKKSLEMTLSEVGRMVGNRDHSTVLNGIGNLQGDCDLGVYNWKRYLVFKKAMDKIYFPDQYNDVKIEEHTEKLKVKLLNKFENVLRNSKGIVLNETSIPKIIKQLT